MKAKVLKEMPLSITLEDTEDVQVLKLLEKKGYVEIMYNHTRI